MCPYLPYAFNKAYVFNLPLTAIAALPIFAQKPDFQPRQR